MPPRPGQGDENTKKAVELELTEGTPEIEAAAPANKILHASALPVERLKELLKRLPPAVAPEKSEDFNIPAGVTPPARPGKLISIPFPPKDTAAAPPVKPQVKVGPLTVIRKGPEGSLSNAGDVSVTFSQAMIPLSDAESEVITGNKPVHITPEPKGKWRWVGTQTLLFKPDGKHLPNATTYKIEIPKGTKSVLGGTLANTVAWTINTPPASLESFTPDDANSSYQQSHDIDQIMYAVFNQDVDASKALAAIHVSEGKIQHSLRLATEQEINDKKKGIASVVKSYKGRIVAFKTTKPFAKDKLIQVDIGPGIPSKEGPLVGKDSWHSEFRTYGPLGIVRTNDAYSPSDAMYIEFNNPLDIKLFKPSMVSCKPSIQDVKIAPYTNGISISGMLKPRAKYNITLDKAIADVYGQTLGTAKTVTIGVGEAPPYLTDPGQPMVILQPSKNPSYSITSTNVQQLKVNVFSANPADYRNFMIAAQKYREWHERPDQYTDLQGFKSLTNKIINIPKSDDPFTETEFDLSPFMKNGLGNVIMTVEKWPRRKNELQRYAIWVQGTRVGLDVCSDSETLIAHASKLEDGSPVANAQISSEAKSPISGKTDKDGVAKITLSNFTPQIIYCKLGDDQSFLPSNQYWWVQEPYAINRRDHMRWYSITDRHLYRPGEKVTVKGWIRKMGWGAKGDLSMLPNTATKVNYSINDSRGQLVGKGDTTLDANGGFNFEFDIPKSANLGSAYMQLTVNDHQTSGNSNSASFQIQEFRRPEFEMKVKSSKGSMILGESTNVTASASYFSGGPLGDTPVNWTVNANSTTYAPAGWSEYKFGKQPDYFSYFFWEGGRPGSDGSYTDNNYTFEGRTDAAGKHIMQMKAKSLLEPFPLSLTVEGTVTDVNRQTWSDKSTVLLHPADVYVGLKPSKQFYKEDESIKLETIVADLDGKAIGDRSVHLEATTESYTYDQDGTMKTDVQKLATADIKSGSTPVEWAPEFKQTGSIKIQAVVTDASGRKNKTEITLWRAGKAPESKKVEQGKILMVADRKKYKPGDTAEIMVQAPFASGRGLVTVRHNGISTTTPISFAESSGSIKIPVTEDMLPNALVQLNLVGANCVFAEGNVNLDVSTDSRKIDLEVKPAQAALEPGGSTDINFNLKDESGKPISNAQVAVAVVDESILALAGHDWADPLSVFYTATSGGAADFHGRQYVILNKNKPKKVEASKREKMQSRATSLAVPKSMPTPSPMAAMRGGGGGGGAGYAAADGAAPPMLAGATNGSIGPQSMDAMAASEEAKDSSGFGGNVTIEGGNSTTPIAIRKDFSALAYFNPALSTDESGKVSCQVKVPDSLTRYRVMAVAVSGAKLFGKGESTITARLPLMVRPSAPRFLNFGDRFELPIVLQNQTDQEMSVDLGLRAANLKFSLKDDKSQAEGIDLTHNSGGNILLPANDRIEVRFPAMTETDGSAALDIAVAAGNNADAASVTIPVYTPATSHAFAAYGQVDDTGAAEQVVEMPKDVFPQVGGLELSTSSTALQSLTDAYIYLSTYSYMCSEQLSSRILSTTALQDVLTAFNKMTDKEIAEAKAQVQGDIKEVCKRQNDDGSFGLWKRGERDYWPFVSIQVVRALHEAKQRKYDVPNQIFDNAKVYLREIESHMPSRDYSEYTKRTVGAYALFVRHLMNDSDPAKARKLIQNALAAYDSKKEGMRRHKIVPVPSASQQDKLLQVLSLESIAWLLPVLSKDKASANEVALLRTILGSRIKETASKAEIADDSDGEYDYYIFYSDSRLNATVLETMILDQPKNDVIPKLAGGLLAHRKEGRWANTQENCTAMLALFRYFNTYEKQVPDFVANTWVGQQYVGQNKFVGRSTETQQINVPMRFLEAHQADKNVVISKVGKGRLYYRLALNYAPKNLLLGAYDNGFTVKRTYEAVDNPDDVKKDADGVWHFKAGATVKAKIEIRSDGRRYHVAMTDPFPAGMEPVNADLQGTKTYHPEPPKPVAETFGVDAGSDEEDTPRRGYFWYPWWDYNWFEHSNLRDFRAEAFASALYSGKFNYTYMMRATTPGDFIVPPTKVEEMYTPETYGRAASEHVIIE